MIMFTILIVIVVWYENEKLCTFCTMVTSVEDLVTSSFGSGSATRPASILEISSSSSCTLGAMIGELKLDYFFFFSLYF